MEFLYRLYSNNYFGIGLFIVITILAFAFLIILFFGKKDEKERKEKKKSIEKDSMLSKQNANAQNIKTVEKLETEDVVSKEDIEEPTKIEESFNFTEEEIISPLEEKSENEKEEDLDLDFTINLSDTLEDDDLFKENEKEEIFTNFEEENGFDIEEKKEVPLRAFSYDLESNENLREVEKEEEDRVVEEIQNKKTLMPPVFSSVYKNKEREEEKTANMNLNTEESVDDLENILPKKEVRIEPIIEEVKPITPKKPEFNLPKRADLPKLNKETENKNNDSIIKF